MQQDAAGKRSQKVDDEEEELEDVEKPEELKFKSGVCVGRRS